LFAAAKLQVEAARPQCIPNLQVRKLRAAQHKADQRLRSVFRHAHSNPKSKIQNPKLEQALAHVIDGIGEHMAKASKEPTQERLEKAAVLLLRENLNLHMDIA